MKICSPSERSGNYNYRLVKNLMLKHVPIERLFTCNKALALFSNIHNWKRNRLNNVTAQKLVYVTQNPQFLEQAEDIQVQAATNTNTLQLCDFCNCGIGEWKIWGQSAYDDNFSGDNCSNDDDDDD